jgi:hypothetical protein
MVGEERGACACWIGWSTLPGTFFQPLTLQGMRIQGRKRLLISLVAYFVAIGALILGAPYALRSAHSTAEQPSFLVPEYLMARSMETTKPTHEAEVLVKPYSPAVSSQVTWRPAIVRSYVARPAETQSPAQKITGKTKSIRAQKARHKRPPNPRAMDAYASGTVWR